MTELSDRRLVYITDGVADDPVVTVLVGGETVRGDAVVKVTVPAQSYLKRGSRRQALTRLSQQRTGLKSLVERRFRVLSDGPGVAEVQSLPDVQGPPRVLGLPVQGLPEVHGLPDDWTDSGFSAGYLPAEMSGFIKSAHHGRNAMSTLVVRREQNDARVVLPEQHVREVVEAVSEWMRQRSPLSLALRLAGSPWQLYSPFGRRPQAALGHREPLMLPVRVSAPRTTQRYLQKAQYFGQVREVCHAEDVFVAWLTEQESGGDRWESKLRLSELKPSDQEELRPGRLFVWTIGQNDEVTETGKVVDRKSESEFIFRAMPVLEEEAEALAEQDALEWAAKFPAPDLS